MGVSLYIDVWGVQRMCVIWYIDVWFQYKYEKFFIKFIVGVYNNLLFLGKC